MPFAPFQTFNSINRGAQSIREMQPIAARFTEVVEDLPAQIRWQLELLLLEVDELETLQTVVAAVDRFSRSSAELVTAVDNMPQNIRTESEALLEDLDERHAALDESLQSAERAAASLQGAVTDAGQIATQIDETVNAAARTADAWTRTAGAVERVVAGIQVLREGDGSPRDPNAPGFNIRDYEAAAVEITRSAEATHKVLVELRNMMQQAEVAPVLDAARTQTADVISESASEFAAVIDHAAWRGLQLIGAIFVLAVLYRLTLGRRPPQAA
jgi:hypothetical protein